jgi:hypothetical protein
MGVDRLFVTVVQAPSEAMMWDEVMAEVVMVDVFGECFLAFYAFLKNSVLLSKFGDIYICRDISPRDFTVTGFSKMNGSSTEQHNKRDNV